MTQRTISLLSVFLLATLWALRVQSTSGESWRVLGHTMARGIDMSTGRPSGNTTRFLTTDEQAVSWFEIEIEGFGPLMLSWKWFEPSGVIYREHTSVELVPRSGVYRFWDVLAIRDTPAEVKLGRWLVEVYVRTVELFRASFLIESPPTSYSVQVKATGFDRRFSTSLYVDEVKVGMIRGSEAAELTFKIGTIHKLSVDEYVQGDIEVRFRCPATSVSVSDESFHAFLYETEYHLKVLSEFGVPKGEGWYKAGSIATFSVLTPVTGQWGIRYIFNKWVGDSTGDSATALILMDGPKKVTALWTADYSQLFMLVAAIAGAVAIVIATWSVTKRRRHAEPVTEEIPPATPKCPRCGRQTLYVERVKRHYCTQCKKYL